jgi:hypothetical protein
MIIHIFVIKTLLHCKKNGIVGTIIKLFFVTGVFLLKFIVNSSKLFTICITKLYIYIYRDGSGKICRDLNIFLHETLFGAPTMILTTLFWNLKT